jgi:hypothetical protein
MTSRRAATCCVVGAPSRRAHGGGDAGQCSTLYVDEIEPARGLSRYVRSRRRNGNPRRHGAARPADRFANARREWLPWLQIHIEGTDWFEGAMSVATAKWAKNAMSPAVANRTNLEQLPDHPRERNL